MFYEKYSLFLWKLQAKEGAREKDNFFYEKVHKYKKICILVEERFNNFLLELEGSSHKKNV